MDPKKRPDRVSGELAATPGDPAKPATGIPLPATLAMAIRRHVDRLLWSAFRAERGDWRDDG
jgi:hypothetical protein